MYFPLHCHSHYSLLDGLSKPEDMVSRIKELGLDGCAITDHGTISGSVSFIKSMRASGLKPILGCELYICKEDASVKGKENGSLNHLVVLAKNKVGWSELIKITSESNRPENFYRKPRLSLDQIKSMNPKDIIAFSGHLGSDLSETIFGENAKLAFSAKTYKDAKRLVDPQWADKTIEMAKKYEGIFGSGNFYIEIQLIDSEVSPAQKVVAEGLRYVSKKINIPCVATPDAHYPRREDAYDQRILLCNLLETTLPSVEQRLAKQEDVSLATFFRSDKYYIPSYEEMKEMHTDEELSNTIKISEMCEDYEILGPPILPPYKCETEPDEYLRHCCREGWKNKIQNSIPQEKHAAYAERVQHELNVLQGAGLSSYFLIVADIINYIRENNWLPGPGRGSAAGCLVSYLLGITSIDPIKYGLIFERFYNAGRNSADHVSMPDIDMDVPVSKRDTKRDEIIEYIKMKHGEDRVGQMITYQTMMGRSAIKDVLRASGGISFEEMNKITQNIPDKAEIADDLEEMKKEAGKSSIIRWALENRADSLKEWCYIDDEGAFQGPLARKFEQAIRLEGTKRAQSKHAAGIVISPQPLTEICPMVLDTKNRQLVGGLEMQDMEDIGMIKFDVLGVAMLDKIMGIEEILENGEISNA